MKTKDKVYPSIESLLNALPLVDGLTLSFHHHLRSGEGIILPILAQFKQRGIKKLTLDVSSLTSAHEGLIPYIIDETVTEIHTSGMRGRLAEAISKNGILQKPVIFRTHGGRARAIESGQVKIDIAFIAASCCDEYGNMNGQVGPSAFGSMGYPIVDAKHARIVVAVTDNLVNYPAYPISIPQTLVDYVTLVPSIGDVIKMDTRISKNPIEHLIAKKTTEVLIASGYVKDGFSFQAGSGGISLSVISYLKSFLIENNIRGSFASGGITKYMVEMLEAGAFNALLDTQTFDMVAAKSMIKNANHIEMSASMYANPNNKGCVSEKLDIMILSATEIDVNFNVNVLTSSLGIIMGAQGGHPDTAEDARLKIVVTTLMRKRIPIVIDKVTTIVTKGEFIDILVTEYGIAIHPKRQDLISKLNMAGIPHVPIETLKTLADQLSGPRTKITFGDQVVGIVEDRHGNTIDSIYNVI
ncbi:citrate lyase subunit alpha [Fusibacter sp. 3D3]|uniref:citrate lyase subunit alpha n=1 Tax=Fusibacter sp. 3D3 TaxID=1048380 RepID=UPI000853D58F|nr:citrate lyase subunit alpha [Fusibacter sp. 3D3]GAU79047.1 citrate lyase alpha chain [Fusibacter sp. 3D3]